MKSSSLIVIGMISLASIGQGSICKAQNGSIKYCPGSTSWTANKTMVENKKEMFNEYALGPDGCWYMKVAGHSSYKEGYYQWDLQGKVKYYFNKKKKFWESADRKTCLAKSPFG
jgi:hypothetical protein